MSPVINIYNYNDYISYHKCNIVELVMSVLKSFLQTSLKLPQVLRRSYVHLSRQSRENIMNKIALIRAEGKQKLIVSKSDLMDNVPLQIFVFRWSVILT